MIERSDQNVQYTCFSSSSMHFRRTNTVVFTMLEHDRHTLSMVVQTTAMLSRSGHDMRVRFPRAHVGPWCHAWTSPLHLLAIFRRERATTAQCRESAASVAPDPVREAVVATRQPAILRSMARSTSARGAVPSRKPRQPAICSTVAESTSSDPPRKTISVATSCPDQDAALHVAIERRGGRASMLSDRNCAFSAARSDGRVAAMSGHLLGRILCSVARSWGRGRASTRQRRRDAKRRHMAGFERNG